MTTTRAPVAGTKGAVESVLVSLASAGALTTFVELVKAWLARDRSRSLKVSWSEDGRLQSVELAGSGLDTTAFDDLVQAVSRRMADPG